jgi:hypothetical protein
MRRTHQAGNLVKATGEGSQRNRDETSSGSTRRTNAPGAALYDGSIIDGEYSDGNIAGLVVAAGKRKSGKTFLAFQESLLCKRKVHFDTLDQYTAEKGYDLKGWQIAHQPGELREIFATNLNAEHLSVIYKPLGGDKVTHFRAVTRLVLNYGKLGRGVIYFVDEIDKFCSPHEPLKTGCPQLYDLVEYGRHFKVSAWFNTRRPHAVSRSLTAQVAEFRIFKTTEPLDKKYFEKSIGSAVKELPRLGKYEYLWWTDDAHRDAEIRGGAKNRGAIHDNQEDTG